MQENAKLGLTNVQTAVENPCGLVCENISCISLFRYFTTNSGTTEWVSYNKSIKVAINFRCDAADGTMHTSRNDK